MRKTLMLAAMMAVLSAPMAQAEGGSWQCENQMDMDRDEAREIAHNQGLFNILNRHRERWDIEHMRAQCEAYAAGDPYVIACLNDRRDWDAITAQVPEEFFGMSNPELTPHLNKMEGSAEGFRDVIAYCRDVGAIK